MKYFFKKSQKMIVYVLVAAMMLSGLMQYNLVNAEAATKTLHYEWNDTSKNSDAGITVSSDSTGKEMAKDLSCDGTKYSKIYRIEKNKKLVIEVTGEGKFVFAVNSESSKDNSVSAYETEGKYLVNDTSLTKDAKQYSVTLSGEGKHTVTISNTGKSKLNVFFVEFTYDETSSGDESKPSTPTSEPEEETTEPSTPTSEPEEETTEPSTPTSEPEEETTEPSTPTSEPEEESSEPSGEVASEYNHNFTEDDFTSDFYTISGGKKTDLSVTVNGKTYTQGLKLNSSGKVTFKSTKEGTLTLVLSNGKSGKAISVDGTEYAVEDATVVITVDKLPAGEHTIERTNGETYLLYIGLSYASDTTAAPAVKHRVELDGNIGVTFAFKDAVAGSKVTFTCDGKDSVDVAYDASNVATIDGTAYAMFSYNVYATEMDKAIKATLYDANGEVIKEDTCSVAQYCKEMLGKESTDDATKAAINALLVYGAEVDAYFEKDATWLKDVTDATLVPLTEPERTALFEEAAAATKMNLAAYDTADINAKAASLYFDTQMAIRIYFEKKDGTAFTAADAAALEGYTFEAAMMPVGPEFTVATGTNKNGFYAEIQNIGPKNIDGGFALMVKDANGNNIQQIDYSPLTFVCNKLNDSKHTNLVTAIYRYNEALENYGTN